MECNKLGLGRRFLKVRAKVTGFLIAKIEKNDMPEQVIVTKKKNTILTTGLQNLLNAFQTYMSGVTYLGENAPSSGIVINTSSGQQVTLLFLTRPALSVANNSVILSFTVIDDTTNSYTAISEELITTSAGYNIPIATTNLSITKNSDEILTMTWVITVSVSPSGNIIYIPTVTPQGGGWSCGSYGLVCGDCVESSANSQWPTEAIACSPTGLSSQYPQTNFITSTLFTDMLYNTYGKGSSRVIPYVSGTTLIIYTLYCLEYFAVGVSNFATYTPNSNIGTSCYNGSPNLNPIYLQVYMPSLTEPYMGVQIEFTT